MKCEICSKEFIKKSNKQKFCSKKCARKTHIVCFDFDVDKTNGQKISEGMAYAKKIKTCSVECLVRELGDIE